VADHESAACWIAVDPTAGLYAYVSNNLSASISSYLVGKNGGLTLLAEKAATGNGPNDLATVGAGDVSFLYVLFSSDGMIGAYQVNLADGSLHSLGPLIGGLPANDGAQGLAAY
jgi:6-phosphogluconolactonase (cycloisomerase 2 family)